MKICLSLSVIVALFGIAAKPALAQNIYQCKNELGKMVTSDKPGGECFGRETRIVGPDGRTLRVIAAPLTEEQKKAKFEEEMRQREDDKRKREQRRIDMALLDTYRDNNDLEAKRLRALEQLKTEVAGSEGRLKSLTKINGELMQEAEFYKKTPMPGELRRKIDDNESATKAEKNTLAAKQKEIVQVNAKFDADKKRLQELADDAKAQAAAPASQPALPAKAAAKK